MKVGIVLARVPIVIIIIGAKGTVEAGLVPLCVERLVIEETSELKVINFMISRILTY